MSTTAEPVKKSEVRQTICIRHPNDNQEMFFCTDCIRVFCTRCQLDDDSSVNHKHHRTITLDEQLHEKRQRIVSTFNSNSAVRSRGSNGCGERSVSGEGPADWGPRQSDRRVVRRFHKSAEEFNSRAKQFLLEKALELWERDPAAAIQQVTDETLRDRRDVCASLEEAIRLAEADATHDGGGEQRDRRTRRSGRRLPAVADPTARSVWRIRSHGSFACCSRSAGGNWQWLCVDSEEAFFSRTQRMDIGFRNPNPNHSNCDSRHKDVQLLAFTCEESHVTRRPEYGFEYRWCGSGGKYRNCLLYWSQESLENQIIKPEDTALLTGTHQNSLQYSEWCSVLYCT